MSALSEKINREIKDYVATLSVDDIVKTRERIKNSWMQLDFDDKVHYVNIHNKYFCIYEVIVKKLYKLLQEWDVKKQMFPHMIDFINKHTDKYKNVNHYGLKIETVILNYILVVDEQKNISTVPDKRKNK